MLKIGIIGAGRIGRVHAEGITNGVKNACVHAIADPYLNDAQREWAGKLGVTNLYTDYHEILNDPEIDAVMICSSTNTHADISVEAIKAGKHIFCEKPISQDLSKIKEVMEALKGTSLKYQVGFNRRFDHNFEAVRNAITAGKIGALLSLKKIKTFRKQMDYKEVGGSALLGVKKPVIKAHGSSDGTAFFNAVRQAKRCVEGNVAGVIEDYVSRIEAANEE